MIDQHWDVIEQALVGMTEREKREVAARILGSIRDESDADARALRQRGALDQLCRTLDAMPAAEPEDGLTNRDHDEILYGA